MTEFFEVISQSAHHIYHSALLLVPQSSIVWNLYSQHICSPVARVVTGIPASWDSCTAAVAATAGFCCAVWSPCGQFIATGSKLGIEVWNSTTLEKVSVLTYPYPTSTYSLLFSHGGKLLACSGTLSWW